MKIEDRIIELAVRQIAGAASAEELQELNDLLQKDIGEPEAFHVLLLEEWTYEKQVPEDRGRLLFEKIKAKIQSKN